MADTNSLKEIFNNGKRLMNEKDYETAAKNFKYLLSKSEENNFMAVYLLSEWCSELKDYKGARHQLSIVIKSFNLGDKTIDKHLYMESLYKHAKIDILLKNYSNSIMLLDTLRTFINKKKVDIDEEFENKINEAKEYAEKSFDKYGDAKKAKSASKNVPYPTESVQKKKSLRAKPYQRLKNIPANKQKEDMQGLWQEMMDKKMDIQEGSKWYIISCSWFNHWKEWTGFRENTTPDTKTEKEVSTF